MDPHGAVDLFFDVLAEDLDGAYHDPESPDEWLRRRAFVDGIYYGLFFALKRAGWKSGVEPLVEAHDVATAAINRQLEASVCATP